MNEYCIWDTIDDCLHRGPMSKDEAVEWIEEFKSGATRPNLVDKIFKIKMRHVSPWETYKEK
jgi:hypothetical protein